MHRFKRAQKHKTRISIIQLAFLIVIASYAVFFVYIRKTFLPHNGKMRNNAQQNLGRDTVLEDIQGISTDKSVNWVKHELHKNVKAPFEVFHAYVVDGDKDRTKFSEKNADLLAIVVGVGEFIPHAVEDDIVNAKNTVPTLYCEFDINGKTHTASAFVHTKGTVYEGKLDRYGNVKFPHEKIVWISCELDPALARTKPSGTIRVFDKENTFETSTVPLEWMLSTEHTMPTYKLSQCSSALWGLSGQQYLLEWIEYHKAVGFDHIYLYLYKPTKAVLEIVEHYRKQGFVSPHDWSQIPEFGIRFPGVHIQNWEHAQRLTRTDCYFRSRGVSNYILFTDVDEIPALGSKASSIGNMKEVTSWLEEQHIKSEGVKIGFAATSVTVPPFPVKRYSGPDADAATVSPMYIGGKKHTLFLDSIQMAESQCEGQYNCGVFHRGRQKYFLRTAYGSINLNSPLFYHAVSENYDISNYLMEQIPARIAYVRHIAGHFKHVRFGGLRQNNRVVLPISESIIDAIVQSILMDDELSQMYNNSPPETFLKLNNFDDMWRFIKSTDDKNKIAKIKSEFHEPPVTAEPTIKPKRYLTFGRFNGRLNNQMLTYDWVFRLSKAFNRTAFIHREDPHDHYVEHYIGFPYTKEEEENGWSLWDLNLLRSKFDLIFEWEIEEMYTTLAEHPVLSIPPNKMNPNCVWVYEVHGKYISEWLEKVNKLPECEKRVHFMSRGGLIHPYKADTSKFGVSSSLFWQYMRPHKYIMNEAKRFLATIYHNKGDTLVGLHTRAHNSYKEPESKRLKRCSRLAGRPLTTAVHHLQSKKKCCNIVEQTDYLKEQWDKSLLDEMCHINQQVLDVIDEQVTEDYTIIFATDHEQKDVDSLVYNSGAISYTPKELLVGRPTVGDATRRKFWKQLEGVLLDMIILMHTDIFYGSPSSTVSQVVCYWRLAESARTGIPEKSNMCEIVRLAALSDSCQSLACDA